MDRNIEERFRKPRRAKGTPVYVQRNYFALGIIAFGGLSWWLYELWAPTNKLKQSIQEGKFDLSPQYKDQIDSLKLIRDEPELESLLYKIRQKKELENETKEKPCFKSEKISKYFTKSTNSSQETENSLNEEKEKITNLSNETIKSLESHNEVISTLNVETIDLTNSCDQNDCLSNSESPLYFEKVNEDILENEEDSLKTKKETDLRNLNETILSESTKECYLNNTKETTPTKHCKSPYKNFLPGDSISNTFYGDDNDFKTLEPIKVAKIFIQPQHGVLKKQKESLKKSQANKTNKSKNQNSIQKILNDNFSKELHSNGDDLQMAIALSKSLQSEDSSCADNEIDIGNCLESPLTKQKMKRIKLTLEQYGFKANKNNSYAELKNPIFQFSKLRKKSKFRTVNPILYLRSDEEREKIISSKVSSILSEVASQNYNCSNSDNSISSFDERNVYSEILKNINCKFKKVFKMNRVSQNENSEYYVQDLNIERTNRQVGALLKNWSEIPGRSPSPIRKVFNIDLTETTFQNSITNETITSNRCNVNFLIGKNSTNENCNVNIIRNINRTNNLNIANGNNNSEENYCQIIESTNQIASECLDKKRDFTALNNIEQCVSPDIFSLSGREEDTIISNNEEKNTFNKIYENETKDSLQTELIQSSPLSVLNEINNKSNSSKEPLIINNFLNQHQLQKSMSSISENKTKENDILERTCVRTSFKTTESHEMLNFTKSPSKSKEVCDLTVNSDEDEVNRSSEVKTNFEKLHMDIITKIMDKYSCLADENKSREKNQLLRNNKFGNENKIFDLTLSSDDEITPENYDLKAKVKNKSTVFNYSVDDLRTSKTKTEQSNSNDEKESFRMKFKQIKSCSSLNSHSGSSTVNKNNAFSEGVHKYSNVLQTSGSLHKSPLSSKSRRISSFRKSLSFSNADINTHKNVDLKDSFNEIHNSRNSNLNFEDTHLLNVTQYINEMLKQDVFISTKTLKSNVNLENEVNNSKGGKSIVAENDIVESCIKKDSNIDKKIEINNDEEIIELDNDFASSQDDYSISDEEFNYSCIKSVRNTEVFHASNKEYNLNVSYNFQDEVFKLSKNLKNSDCSSCSFHNEFENKSEFNNDFDEINKVCNELEEVINDEERTVITDTSNKFTAQSSFLNSSKNKSTVSNKITPTNLQNQTPDRKILIKTTNVTPMSNYDSMNTPTITKELQKFGLKALKRKRGVQILKYIYDSTHPVIGNDAGYSNSIEENTFVKKAKLEGKNKEICYNFVKSCLSDVQNLEKIKIVGDIIGDENEENLIFERKQSKRVHSCRVPLDIIWHNYVSSQPQLLENVLLYEPLQLEVIYSIFKEFGYKFHIQDLQTFFDRKCITIRTNQNQKQVKKTKKNDLN